MNKKIIISIAILTFISLAIFVSATYEIVIPKGWNIIYGLTIFPDENLNDVFGNGKIEAVYAYIPSINDYAQVYPNPELDKLREMDDDELLNTAFWVYAESGFDWDLQDFKTNNGYLSFDERQLYSGWNFVGITEDMYTNEDELLSFTWNQIKGTCDIEKVYFYASQENPPLWAPVEFDMPLDDDFVGLGMIVKVKNNCKLKLISEDTEEPPLVPN